MVDIASSARLPPSAVYFSDNLKKNLVDKIASWAGPTVYNPQQTCSSSCQKTGLKGE